MAVLSTSQSMSKASGHGHAAGMVAGTRNSVKLRGAASDTGGADAHSARDREGGISPRHSPAAPAPAHARPPARARHGHRHGADPHGLLGSRFRAGGGSAFRQERRRTPALAALLPSSGHPTHTHAHTWHAESPPIPPSARRCAVAGIFSTATSGWAASAGRPAASLRGGTGPSAGCRPRKPASPPPRGSRARHCPQNPRGWCSEYLAPRNPAE